MNGLTTPNPLPQVWQPDGSLRDLTSAQLTMEPYPRLYLAPDGRVFHVGPEQATYFLDTSGTGRWTKGPSRKFGNRKAGTSVMYDDGKVLVVGGGKPTNSAETIDLNAASPAWRYTGAMAHARRNVNATVLPDGEVLVTGGSSSPANDAAGAVLAAEMWDPATGAWTTMASMRVPRVYHSTAILLPDGRVLSAGGGHPAADARRHEQPQRRDLLPALPVQGSAAHDRLRAHRHQLWTDVLGTDAGCVGHRQGAIDPAVLGDAQHQHEPAYRDAELHSGRRCLERDNAVQPEPASSWPLHAVHPQQPRRAVDREHRPGRLTPPE